MSEAKTTKNEATKPIEVLARVDVLASAAGLLPEFLASTQAARPAQQNPRHWIYRAVCVRTGWTEHSLVTQEAFNQAVEAVSEITVR
jgi:hypothetical protein